MPNGHKHYSDAERQPIGSLPILSRSNETPIADAQWNAFVRREDPETAPPTQYRAFAARVGHLAANGADGAAQIKRPDCFDLTAATRLSSEADLKTRRKIFKERRDRQEGTPISEILFGNDRESCYDFLEDMRLRSIRGRNIPLTRKRKGIIGPIVKKPSQHEGYRIGYTTDRLAFSRKTNKRSELPPAVYLSEAGTLYAFHESSGLEPLPLTNQGFNTRPCVGNFIETMVGSSDDWVTDRSRSPQFGPHPSWVFVQKSLAEMLSDVAMWH
jgi:hypothetical protein